MVSPIKVDKLEAELGCRSDRATVKFVTRGLCYGFRLGFNPESVSLKSALQNMSSALLQPSVINNYLLDELKKKGRTAGLFSAPPISNLYISRFGVIPKKHQSGKWHLILDLSSPAGVRINDGIPKDPFTVQYMSVEDIIDGIMAYRCGTLMAKFDIKSAYCIVPVHPGDRFFLGMQWLGNFFKDLVLPIGLWSAPFTFTALADLLEWVLRHYYNMDFVEHYLHDFHMVNLYGEEFSFLQPLRKHDDWCTFNWVLHTDCGFKAASWTFTLGAKWP